MERTFEYVIPIEYAGKKVYEFLRSKGFSHQNLTDIKNKGYEIKVNGESVFRNYILAENDFLQVHFVESENSEHIPPVDIPIDIVYEDRDVLVVNKPSDMPIHPSLNNYENSLGNAVMHYYNSRGIDFVYRCINRLDRDTSGLALIAKNSVSANILGEQQKKGLIEKEYIAIVSGDVEVDEGVINKPIGRLPGSTIERIVDYNNGKEAITHFQVLRRCGNITLVGIKLETGRTHQIRVHMKSIGHPLVGDFLYNPEDRTMERQALHVGKLSFFQPITGEKIVLKQTIPADMKSII